MAISSKRIRIPVQWIDGHWELLYGGSVKVRDGCIAELEVSSIDIVDKAFREALTAKRLVRILDQGAELRVALSIRSPLDTELGKLFASDPMEWDRSAKVSAESRFVSIFLGAPNEAQVKSGEKRGGLWLALEGVMARSLESSHVLLPPELNLDPAISINHAFTLLSERFEPWRKAHTASIYERVFYKEANGCWYRLDDLREKELATAERAIVLALWKEVESTLRTKP